MPNWCDCTYKCVGVLKEVRSLHKALKYIDKRKTSIIKNSLGKWWLGNLVVKLGGNWKNTGTGVKLLIMNWMVIYSLSVRILLGVNRKELEKL